MKRTILRGRFLRWGHSYAIRVRRRDRKRIPAKIGDEVTVIVEGREPTVDLSDLPLFDDPKPTTGRDHDRVLADHALKEMRGKKR